MQSMSENDFECFASTGVKAPRNAKEDVFEAAAAEFRGPAAGLRCWGVQTTGGPNSQPLGDSLLIGY